jgi:MoaA/NifB/PqqE/SkfB family radical SAM enzyme
LLRKKGNKMVALYGATAEVHDYITRTPGSFEATMQGLAYMRETKAGFVVQVVPMRDNHHQLDRMVALARELSPLWRIGASWLYLSSCGDQSRGREIANQRLEPREPVELDRPDFCYRERVENGDIARAGVHDGRLFAACIQRGSGFHVDPYGEMSFCGYIHDPALR